MDTFVFTVTTFNHRHLIPPLHVLQDSCCFTVQKYLASPRQREPSAASERNEADENK